ncbi:MAG: metallophosphoesterase [Actinobacteria bacterium]|nr:metallophosphoesterase [Actinomycetota bacterium]
MGFVVREAEMPILPTGRNPIRILHFSDLHLTPDRKREIADIKSFVGLEPDLVISTGDFLGSIDALPVVLDALDGLLDLPGLFVFGSNDYFAPRFKNPFSYLTPDNGKRLHGEPLPSPELASSLTSRGWRNLNFSRALLAINGSLVEARGTDDAHLNRDDYSLVAGKPDPKADIAFGVTHAPYLRLLDAMRDDDLDAIFAGHTHGGQVRLPWIGGSRALATNCDLPTWRARGLTRFGQEPWLHVSAGMGTSPYARIRVASPPEVSLVTLTPSGVGPSSD